MRLTIVIKKGESGYLVGQLKELPAVFTQGTTVKELKSNILEALELYFEDLREQYEGNGDMIAEEELHLV
jgi:predicted RNase H-like HicB family nuclease